MADTLSRLFVRIGADTSEFQKSMNDMQTKMQQVGKSMKKVGTKLTTTVTAPLAGAFTALTVGTRDFRETLAPLETNAEQAGVGMDKMSEAMKQMEGITGETDSNVEGLSNLLASGFKGDQFQTVLDNLSGAAVKFKDTMKFEGVADGLQETLATGEAIGPFAELLERSGISLDEFNAGLKDAKKNGTEHNHILNTLADTGLSKTYEAYRENNKEITEQKEAAYSLREELARLGEKLEPLLTKITNIAVDLVSWFNDLSPATQKLVGVTLAFAAALGPVLIIVGQLITAISTITPILTAAAGVISGIAAGPLVAIAAAAVGVIAIFKNWDKIFEFVTWVAEKVVNAIDWWVEKAVDAFSWMYDNTIGIFESMWNGIKQVINWIIGGINKVINALNKISVDVPDWVPGFGGATWGFDIQNVPELAEGGNIALGGSAIVGEEGPELVDLPTGATVTPLNNNQSVASDVNINATYNVTDRATAEYANNDLLKKLKARGIGGAYR